MYQLFNFGIFKFGIGTPKFCPTYLKLDLANLYLAWADFNSAQHIRLFAFALISLLYISLGHLLKVPRISLSSFRSL